MFHNPRDYILPITANPALSSIANCPALNEPTKVARPNEYCGEIQTVFEVIAVAR